MRGHNRQNTVDTNGCVTAQEQEELKDLISKGRAAAHKQTHARVLLLSDENSSIGSKKDKEIVDALEISLGSVEQIRQRFVEKGLESVINSKPKTKHRPKKLDGAAEAFLVATACTPAPEGCADWQANYVAEMN